MTDLETKLRDSDARLKLVCVCVCVCVCVSVCVCICVSVFPSSFRSFPFPPPSAPSAPSTPYCCIRAGITLQIVTDGVFSMDGNIAPLKEICDLADEYSAIVLIDECHATGFFGKVCAGLCLCLCVCVSTHAHTHTCSHTAHVSPDASLSLSDWSWDARIL